MYHAHRAYSTYDNQCVVNNEPFAKNENRITIETEHVSPTGRWSWT